MTQRFEIAVEEWISEESPDPQIQATAAEISIKVGPYCATEVEDRRAKTVRKTIRASAALLASWLLSNWWRLRWETSKDPARPDYLDWELSHSLPATGGGYIWPPLTFESDGTNILLRCDGQAKNDPSSLASIRYLNSFEESIAARSFESSIAKFVEHILERLDSTGVRNSFIHQMWSETVAEQEDPKQAAQRKLEALLGLDPDEDGSFIKDLLTRWQHRVGKDALEEIAAASESSSVEEVLGRAEQATKSVETNAEIKNTHQVRRILQGAVTLNAMMPWQQGRKAAYILRDEWGFGMKPISTEKIGERLHLSTSELTGAQPKTPFSLAVRGETDDKFGLVLSRHHTHSRRFDIARLVGDHLVFETNDRWKPATHALTARQKFQRAFAAEFLCPSEELVKRFESPIELDDLDDVTCSVSEEYKVSQQLVLNHLANRNLIPQSASKAQAGFTDHPLD
jgi:hypothetical protein